jgi:hypothetical protein
MDMLSCSYEGGPGGKRITVCAVGEAYITEFGRGIRVEGASAFSVDGSFRWPTSLALDKEGNDSVADEWLNRLTIFTMDGDWIGHMPQEGRHLFGEPAVGKSGIVENVPLRAWAVSHDRRLHA